MTAVAEDYVTADERGPTWHMMLGDACERLAEINAESVDLSVHSPPFASLYTYSPSLRDLGNCTDRGQFLEHYGFVIRELLRVTKPGRVACVHVAQLTTTKSMHGVVGLTDFRGDVIRAWIEAGWIFHGEVTVDKNPQAQAIRTKAQALMFVQKNKDSSKTRPALADYLLVFRAPGENAVPIKNDVSNEEWIQWAHPIWPGLTDEENAEALVDLGLLPASGGWYGIRESNTLNYRSARENADERHICPLQVEFIERCVRLWSNPGETVLSPCAGIGSELWVSVKLGRRALGVELKESYWRTAVANLRKLDADMAAAPANAPAIVAAPEPEPDEPSIEAADPSVLSGIVTDVRWVREILGYAVTLDDAATLDLSGPVLAVVLNAARAACGEPRIQVGAELTLTTDPDGVPIATMRVPAATS